MGGETVPPQVAPIESSKSILVRLAEATRSTVDKATHLGVDYRAKVAALKGEETLEEAKI